jgi:hypothetical protein
LCGYLMMRVSALQQRRVSTNFRDNALLNVFKVALVALRYLLDNRADEKLKEQVGDACACVRA